MGIGFVDEAIVPDVQTDEYERDQWRSQPIGLQARAFKLFWQEKIVLKNYFNCFE